MKKTVLLFGGSSGERLVSVASAQNLVENFNFDEIAFLDQLGSLYLVSKPELLAHANPFLKEFATSSQPMTTSLLNALDFFKSKTIFLAFHGTEGEDGKIQKIFEDHKINFTASGSLASQNAFNKKDSKKIVAAANIQITDELCFTQKDIVVQKSKIVNFLNTHRKIVLKPIANGSSIGIYIVDQIDALETALQKISTSNLGEYIAEKFIEGRELTVGVYESAKGLIALPPSEVILSAGRSFDYEGKYLGQGATEVTPAQLSASEIQDVQAMALQSHSALNCYGYSRTDLILTKDGPIYLETNTLPGLSRPSFLPQQLNVADIKFSDFIQRQLELAEKRYF